MKVRMILLGSVFFLGMMSCQKRSIDNEIIAPVEDTTKTNLHPDVVWQVPLAPDLSENVSSIPIIQDDKVFFVNRFYKPYDEVFACDKLTGEKLWYWDNNFNRQIPEFGGMFSKDDNLIIGDGVFVYNVDTETGRTRWETKTIWGGSPINVIGGYIYNVVASGGSDFDEANLTRTRIGSPKWDTLFSVHRNDNRGLSPGLIIPSLWLNPKGDSILIFHSRDLRFSPIATELDLYAYHLNSGELLWHQEIIGKTNLGTRHPPVIHNNKIYLQDSEHILCFDAQTGEEIWEYGPVQGNGNCAMVIAEDKLFVNPDGEQIMALDLEDGSIIWFKLGDDVPASPRNMVYYNGLIYTNGIPGVRSRLSAYRASDGKLVWSLYPPNKEKYPNVGFANSEGGIAIDEDLGYLYVSDGIFAMCIRLPE